MSYNMMMMMWLAASVPYSLLLLSSVYPQLAAATSSHRPHHNNYTDLQSLLAFKSQADPFGILAASWTTNASFCEWVGVSCGNPRRQRVTALNLGNFSLQGTIAPHLGNLSFLSFLYLANCSLAGQIPDTLGRLPRLSSLALFDNTLSGPIPNSIFNMSSLTDFSVAHNILSGSLPSIDNVIRLPRLQFISVSVNQLTGEIPRSFSQCKNLQTFSLYSNKFTGNIPSAFGHLRQLQYMRLGNNQLSGVIPSSFGNLTNLYELSLDVNNLTGSIPNALGSLLNLQMLNLLKNDLDGSIPISLLNASSLNYIDIGSNKLTGLVPATIGASMPLLNFLTFANNRLIGGLDFIKSLSNCKALHILQIAENEFGGVLPISIGNLSTQLQRIAAFKIDTMGNIPTSIGNLSGIMKLDLGENELKGPIPSEVGKLKRLHTLDLDSNGLSGHIPHEIGQLKSLNYFYQYNTKLSGPIPYSLGNLTELLELSLDGNSLSSTIPLSLWNLTSLFWLELSNNHLSGTLPLEMGNLQRLIHLTLNNNLFSGNISIALGKLQMLSNLDLSNNSFSGQIPQSLGDIISIEYMNLSHNVLSGPIPKSLANLRYLSSLDLSFNNLEGKIPEGTIFSNLSIPSLQGNKALCGATRLGFPPCPDKISKSTSTRRLQLIKCIVSPIASALILLAFFYFLSNFIQSRGTKAQSSYDSQWLTSYRSISYYELVRATENFSEANLLGSGSCSSVYKACLDDGMIVALKVINLASQGASESFESECRALSTVRHKNLVKIITTCSNLDFKSIVIQFMQNDSLEKWLYFDDLHLTLLQRIQIMVDVASALEYLHHQHPQVIIHCDLKPSNVLLDENMVAHVGDFGIAKLFYGDSVEALSANARGTIGYMAPDYGFTGKASRKGDVYSFGILLLETITRKKPTDVMFNEELNLRQWVSRAYPARMIEIVDYKILEDDCVNERTPDVLGNIYQCLTSIIEVGLLCSIESPNERLSMKDVVPRLQKIKLKYLADSTIA